MPQAAPPAIAELLAQIDAAASRKDLNAVMNFYSPTLVHGDGLTYKNLEQALKSFWSTTSSVQYQTQVNQWTTAGADQAVAETTTTIKGLQVIAQRQMQLTATVRSRIKIMGQKIVSQDILSEKTQLTSGEKPPIVTVNLPEQVNVGETFSFDAVVKDPIGDDLLLGAAVEEPITPEGYTQLKGLTLEPLPSGGLFKVGQAPALPTREWISAILIQDKGITIVSQRIAVVKPSASSSTPPKESQPAKNKSTEAKPAETKPNEGKP